MVKAGVGFDIGTTCERTEHNFLAPEVSSETIRNQIASLGSLVYVTYDANGECEIPDSNVTFKTITPFGVTEIIYDFALTKREFETNREHRDEYYFVKVAYRIYCRRRS